MTMQITKYLFPLIVICAAAFSSVSCEQKVPAAAEQIDVVKTGTPVENKAEIKRSPGPNARQPNIVSRLQWKAKGARGEAKTHTIRYITLHHTAAPQKKGVAIESKMQNLQHFSQSESRLASGKMKPVWFDVPYHYYIAVDGKIAEGRDIKFVGDTNTDYDPAGHALIAIEGNFEIEDPSSEQLESLNKLLAWLAEYYEVPISEIKTHSDYASTACPGENLKKLLPHIRQKLRQNAGAETVR